MSRHRAINAICIALLALAAACAPGCKSSGKQRASTTPTQMATPVLLRRFAMNAADTYSIQCFQALEALARTTKRADVRIWAKGQVVGTGYAAMINATGPNDAGAMLDMLVLVTLKRSALEEYWIPQLLHEEGEPVLKTYRKAEEEVWAEAQKVLTAEQIEQIRQLIEAWRQNNPGQYYVGDIRFSEFDSLESRREGKAVKIPSNILGLMYIDPLAGLDPVTAELKNYRDLTERMMFAAVRIPRIVGMQVDYQLAYFANQPELSSVIQSSAKFSDATSRFADAVAKYPNQFRDDTQAMVAQTLKGVSAERQAALDQANAAITSQRDAILKELDAQQSKLHQLIGDVNGVLDRAGQTGKSLNLETAQTITTTEQATRRTMDRAFAMALTLILVLLLGIPLSLVLYRLAARRWVHQTGPGAAPCPTPGPSRAGS